MAEITMDNWKAKFYPKKNIKRFYEGKNIKMPQHVKLKIMKSNVVMFWIGLN